MECSIAGCERPSHIRGWCKMHYERWRNRKGDPSRFRPNVEPLPNALWNHLDRSGGENSCWMWLGKRSRSGYGILHRFVRIDGITAELNGAHRIAYAIANQTLPTANQYVMHACDNPPCCNPAHLRVGLPTDNHHDMILKGRAAHAEAKLHRGMQHGRAKLTDDQVIEIRRRYASGGISQPALGREFGVSHPTIGAIVRRTGWTHI